MAKKKKFTPIKQEVIASIGNYDMVRTTYKEEDVKVIIKPAVKVSTRKKK